MEMLEISDGTNDVKSGTEIKIDYFSGTFEFRNFSDDDELKDVEGTVEAIANLLNVPKEEILEGYLNSIYFNHGIYGIYDASKYYFNLEPKDLSYAQAAVLAAIIKAPSKYAPDVNYLNNEKRKSIILKTLLNEKIITSNWNI